VRSNLLPTELNYTQRAPANSLHCQIALSGSVAGQWYVGVRGVPAPTLIGDAPLATFTIGGAVASLCPQRCSEHGRCVLNQVCARVTCDCDARVTVWYVRAQCNCQAGYVGDDCSSERLMLTPGVPFRGSVSFDRWCVCVCMCYAISFVHLGSIIQSR
jgi:hypothetical protein